MSADTKIGLDRIGLEDIQKDQAEFIDWLDETMPDDVRYETERSRNVHCREFSCEQRQFVGSTATTDVELTMLQPGDSHRTESLDFRVYAHEPDCTSPIIACLNRESVESRGIDKEGDRLAEKVTDTRTKTVTREDGAIVIQDSYVRSVMTLLQRGSSQEHSDINVDKLYPVNAIAALSMLLSMRQQIEAALKHL